MSTVIRTPGQIAYEADVARCPCYHDGKPRVAWDRLGRMAQESWERDPRPRTYKPRNHLQERKNK